MRNPFQLGDKALFVDSRDSENELNGCIVEIVNVKLLEVSAIILIPSTIGRKLWFTDSNTATITLDRAMETLTIVDSGINSADTKYYKSIHKIKQLDAAFEKRQKGKLK
jgi:hypothetical protein